MPERADGLPFAVSRFSLEYATPMPDLPPLGEVSATSVGLLLTSQGYVAPRAGQPVTQIRIDDAAAVSAHPFYSSAIRTINEAIVGAFVAQGLAGVQVLPHHDDVDRRSWRDTRAGGRQALRLEIWIGRVLEQSTYGSGSRLSESELRNHPSHQKIKDNSPVKPGEPINIDALREYLYKLSRHPGRAVDFSLAAASEPGGLYLDYLVAEDRPYHAYVQGSNTGTEETGDWRERFGVQHNQLTGRDDILRVDYITSGFDQVNAVFGTYETPILPEYDWFRVRVGSTYSDYDASQLGSQATFSGKQWSVSGQMIANVWQWGPMFVDAFAGTRYMNVDVTNVPFPGFETVNTANFFLPEVGLVLERLTLASSLRSAVSFEWNIPSLGRSGINDINAGQLGRNMVTESHFKLLHWDVSTSLYLEPLISRLLGDRVQSRWLSSYANEIALSSNGQYAFGYRLSPQFESVAGGVYTVRGYPHSAVAADNMYMGRAEYRIHIPRLLPPDPTPLFSAEYLGDFYAVPPQAGGFPSWDLILRGFFDFARAEINDRIPNGGEDDETLMGAGLGLELHLWDNLIVSFDWGRALRDVGRDSRVRSGSSEYHFVGTLVF